jgi:MarR family transcriptional regulator, organic hydroperoxide resistance regulator
MSDFLRVENQLCFSLYAASRAMTSAYQPLLEAFGLTYPQYLVMLVLWEEDGVKVSRIGERLCLDSATITPLLKRLEARGVLTRRRNKSDERVVEIFLTEEGLTLKKKAEGVPREIFCRTGLSLDELSTLRRKLQEITRRLLEKE